MTMPAFVVHKLSELNGAYSGCVCTDFDCALIHVALERNST